MQIQIITFVSIENIFIRLCNKILIKCLQIEILYYVGTIL